MPAIAELVRPAHLWVPEHASTSGPECTDLAALAGMILDAEQQLALDGLLAERQDGTWASFEAALICARQNLKTFVLRAIALHRLFLLQDRLTVWTAHEFATAMEAFRDLTEAVDGCADLSRKVKKVNNTNGEEAIELHSGARLIFRARSKRAGRGLSGNTVILDEAFALMPHHLGSLLPTLSAVPNSQVFYGSSAGHLTSSTLRALRERGRKGNDPSLAYLEWCAPDGGCGSETCEHALDAVDCALDNEANWLCANPALGRRISYTAIRAERRALPPQEFARERLGWWEDPGEGAADKIPPALWSAAADTTSLVVGIPSFAVDVTPDRARTSISVAGYRADGRVHVEVIRTGRGTGWVATALDGIVQRAAGRTVVLDAAGPAGSLIGELEERGLDVTSVTAREHAQACGLLVDLVTQERLRHLDQPELNMALAGACTRDLGDGAWAWSRRSSLVDISPLVAATLALHGLTSEPDYDVLDSVF